ncbi:MAG: type II toxin-antitoxin system VapB family antitoxin [Actinobacteria bacterium]|nr:type II toxin-antitoxin system VapB family antitoxin [Actinomycetota bacterium]
MVKRTSMNVDLDLVREAQVVLGTSGTTETVHAALREIVRRERLRRLAQRDFSDLDVAEIRRWRTETRDWAR